MLSKIMDFWMTLLGMKAPVTEPEPTPVVEVKEEPKPIAKPKPKPKAKVEKPKEEAVDLSKMTKAELIKYAEGKGIEVNPRSKKADIILKLQ